MTDSPDTVAVVGAGAVGLSAATELAGRGVDVTLYDRAQPGDGSTGRAAGLCYDAYVEHTDARLANRSLERFRSLGVVTECPYVWVARDGDDHAVAAIREQAERMSDRGRDVSLHSPKSLSDRFPGLKTEDIAVGAVAENAGYVDTDEYVTAMVEAATEAGVTLRSDCAVSLTPDGKFSIPSGTVAPESVLLAAGPHTKPLAADAGHSLALGTYRAQALRTDSIDGDLPIYYDATERFYLRPAADGVLVGNGAHRYDGDPDAYDPAADPAFVERSLSRVEERVGASPSAVTSWAGLCTATPDRDPLVGALADGLYVATGWHGHGFMRAPAIGEILATQMLGGAGIDHFDPTRFDGDEQIDLPAGIVD
jgi:sarcosine oxidase subunit beta